MTHSFENNDLTAFSISLFIAKLIFETGTSINISITLEFLTRVLDVSEFQIVESTASTLEEPSSVSNFHCLNPLSLKLLEEPSDTI